MNTKETFKNAENKPDGYTLLAAVPSVCLAWATRVRQV